MNSLNSRFIMIVRTGVAAPQARKSGSRTPHHSELALERHHFNGCSSSCPQAAGLGSCPLPPPTPSNHSDPIREKHEEMDGWLKFIESGHDKAKENGFLAHANSLLPVKPVKG